MSSTQRQVEQIVGTASDSHAAVKSIIELLRDIFQEVLECQDFEAVGDVVVNQVGNYTILTTVPEEPRVWYQGINVPDRFPEHIHQAILNENAADEAVRYMLKPMRSALQHLGARVRWVSPRINPNIFLRGEDHPVQDPTLELRFHSVFEVTEADGSVHIADFTIEQYCRNRCRFYLTKEEFCREFTVVDNDFPDPTPGFIFNVDVLIAISKYTYWAKLAIGEYCASVDWNRVPTMGQNERVDILSRSTELLLAGPGEEEVEIPRFDSHFGVQ
ncbi:hypothetical protein BU24DRAFT_479213 [Aaosphaeria arxii CBS 175.79]|uniref:Uncharacterized protein n=1 Tax=Aaosphaeria arxii CBS 175.79 TaxID=1450172 RepID=A0A6A5XYC6_9PLEO|nr:uncharacterized protein BU24DRAFT_479213 [Aaosphaeria arxii CBS 175.79]KAF2017959.1 hypothetical protein BU24DRAFT_479213 [Aaosphaeria arxii CBS 175.79]